MEVKLIEVKEIELIPMLVSLSSANPFQFGQRVGVMGDGVTSIVYCYPLYC